MQNERCILGINPGTRYIGLAVLKNGELIDWRTKTFKQKWSKKKLETITNSLEKHIKNYKINIIAIKKLHPSRSSKALNEIVSNVKKLARRKKIKVDCFTIEEIKMFFDE